MIDNQAIAIAAIQGGHKAQMKVLDEIPSGIDCAPEQLDSWIKPSVATEMEKIVFEAEAETPEFLRGVLFTHGQVNRLLSLIQDAKYALKWGAIHQHEVNRSHKAGQAMVAGILCGTLEKIGETP